MVIGSGSRPRSRRCTRSRTQACARRVMEIGKPLCASTQPYPEMGIGTKHRHEHRHSQYAGGGPGTVAGTN
eukprot:6190118-Pleurochrysis_carterae.AAC.1